MKTRINRLYETLASPKVYNYGRAFYENGYWKLYLSAHGKKGFKVKIVTDIELIDYIENPEFELCNAMDFDRGLIYLKNFETFDSKNDFIESLKKSISENAVKPGLNSPPGKEED